MTHIPLKQLTDTCEFIHASYLRKVINCIENDAVQDEIYHEHFYKLSGISNLYVGKDGHSVVQSFITRLTRARERQILRAKSKSGVARSPAFCPDDVGQGATQLDQLVPLQAG